MSYTTYIPSYVIIVPSVSPLFVCQSILYAWQNHCTMFRNQHSFLWSTKWLFHSILSAVTIQANYSIWLLGSISYYHESISAKWHHWNLSAVSFMESVFFSATQQHHSWFEQCLYDKWFVKLACTRPTKGTATWSHLLICYIFCWESVLEFS